MKLTPAILRNLYATIICCDPFTIWKMPLPEEVDFVVTDDPELMGTYLYDTGGDYEHTITISSARCAFFSTVFVTMLHECVHLSFHRQKGDKWLHHGKVFRERCTRVGKALGVDHLEL